MTTFNYTPSMTPDLSDALAYETSLPGVDASGGFEDPAVAEWHRARLAQSVTTPTLSSTGRRSFRVVHTSERFDYSTHATYDVGSIVPERSTVRVKARDLIALADEWMSDHASECDGCKACGWHDDACTDDGCVPGCGHAPIRLMGRDGDGRHFAQVIRADRSANTGDSPGEFAGWPTRYGLRGMSGRRAASLTPVPVTVDNPFPSDGMPATLTVHAIPSAHHTSGMAYVGNAAYPTEMTQAESRKVARLARDARETSVNAPVVDDEAVSALWDQCEPGERVTGDVRGHEMTISRGVSGQVRVTYNGTSWKARTARSVAARIA